MVKLRLGRYLQRITPWFHDKRLVFLLLVIFVLNVVLVSPKFNPPYWQINQHDEAKYIDSGRSLINGQMRGPEWGPLLSFLYALIYPFVQHSEHWFFLSMIIGRFALFTLLWLSLIHLGRNAGGGVTSLILAGLYLVTRLGTNILTNSSDVLFAALSAFALSQILLFVRTRNNRALSMAGLFIALSILTRNDGWIIFFLAVGLVISLKLSRTAFGKAIVVIAVPVVLVSGSYLLVARISVQEWLEAAKIRSYHAFEQGYWVVNKGSWEGEVEETRRIFGDPEDNDYSIIQAIARNPEIHVDRIRAMLATLPTLIITTYDKRIAPILFFLTAVGIYHYVKQREFKLLIPLLLWPLHLLVYFLTFFRDGYLLLPTCVVLVLSGVGIARLSSPNLSARERSTFLLILIALILISIFSNKPAFIAGLVVFLLGISLAWLAQGLISGIQAKSIITSIILLSAGLIIRDGYSFPDFRAVGSEGEEQAIAFMGSVLPQGSNVVVYNPLPALASRMTPVKPERITTQEELRQWTAENAITAFFVDVTLCPGHTELCAAMDREVGGSLELAYTSQDGRVKVLLVR